MTRTLICLFRLALFSTLATQLIVSADVEAGEAPVVFGDPDLKSAIEIDLGIVDPTPADMLELTNFYITGSGLSDLPGMEYALNLRNLGLPYNQISELGPLEGLTNLI